MVSNTLAQQYFAAAEELAKGAVANLTTPCSPATPAADEAGCLEKFLDTFGQRAWRRPLEADERENLRRAFRTAAPPASPTASRPSSRCCCCRRSSCTGSSGACRWRAQSYLRLTSWELASRLSYLLWGSMPDEPLFAAAAAGKLGTREEVAGPGPAHAGRPAQPPRWSTSSPTSGCAWTRLSSLEKQAAVYPTFKPELRAALHQEAQPWSAQVVWKGDGKLATLLTAPYTFLNGPLAAFYGIPGVTADTFQQVSLDPKRRGRPADPGRPAGGAGGERRRADARWSTAGCSCASSCSASRWRTRPPTPRPWAPPPPPRPPPASGPSPARRWPLCNACHLVMDPVGFAFENFDGAGLYRTMDHGQPVDARGELAGTDIDGTFDGAVALVNKLATSHMVEECLATQLFRYGYGRAETDKDACAARRPQGRGPTRPAATSRSCCWG